MATTRFGLEGYGVRRTGSFAGKTPDGSSSHPVGRITRFGLEGYGVRRAGSFAGKTADGGVTPEPSPPAGGLGIPITFSRKRWRAMVEEAERARREAEERAERFKKRKERRALLHAAKEAQRVLEEAKGAVLEAQAAADLQSLTLALEAATAANTLADLLVQVDLVLLYVLKLKAILDSEEEAAIVLLLLN